MPAPPPDPPQLLDRALESGRIHSAYLLSGDSEATREAALRFVRGLVCRAEGERPCDACRECARSAGSSAKEDGGEIEIDPTGKRGPLYRHVGDHPDLLWVDRGDGTRVRIGQVRAVQAALQRGSNEGGYRAAVIADAEWLNLEAQNALLRTLEEPPTDTCLLLATPSAAGLLATIRSRCQRVHFRPPPPPALRGETAEPELRECTERLDGLARQGLPELLDWAEEFRGERATAAENVQGLLATGSAWLRERVVADVNAGHTQHRTELAAFRALSECRKDLAQRNANPQMVAERALLALRAAASTGPS